MNSKEGLNEITVLGVPLSKSEVFSDVDIEESVLIGIFVLVVVATCGV